MRAVVIAGSLAFYAIHVSIHAASATTAGTPAPERLNRASYQHWLLPAHPPYPPENKPIPARIALGKKLFFDPRVSRDGNMSCASCHSPMFGWSDGLAKSRGFNGQQLGRASPTVINTAYNTIQMWDGRKKNLEDQAMGPLEAAVEMNADFDKLWPWLNQNSGYRKAFAAAYPGEPIGADTFRKAIASYERTIISRTSPFDHWIAGDDRAMSAQQLRGMRIFMDAKQGNCVACHGAPNFTDNGFHNLGLASHGKEEADLGRFAHKPVAVNKGAFKTPTLRDIERTAPYFHDGSARTLMDVVEHYNKGGEVKKDLSPNMRPLNLSQQDKEDLVAFMRALSSPQAKLTLPELPSD